MQFSSILSPRIALAMRSSLTAVALLACSNNAVSQLFNDDTETLYIESQTENYVEGLFNAYKSAELYDPRLRQALYNYKADQEEDNISFGALLPNVQVNAHYQYEDSDNIYTDEDSSFYDDNLDRSGGQLIDHALTVTIQQPLFDIPAYKEYRSSKSYIQASGYTYQRERQELIFRVSEQYLKTLLAAQEVYLYQQKLEALELKRSQVERAKELQISDQLNLLHASANRDIAYSDFIHAKSILSDAQTLLTNITGKAVELPDNLVNISYQISPDFKTEHLDYWLQGLTANTDVQAAVARTQMARHTLSARRSEHLPRVGLHLNWRDRESEDQFRTRTDAVASVEVSMPLYSGGRTKSGTRQAKAKLLAYQAELDYIRAQKDQQIKLAYNRVSSYSKRLQALAQSRESSKGFLEAAERQQSLKLSDQVTVLEAQTQLLDTQIQFAKTLNDYLLSDLTLRLETGRLDEDRLHTYDQLFSAASEASPNMP